MRTVPITFSCGVYDGKPLRSNCAGLYGASPAITLAESPMTAAAMRGTTRSEPMIIPLVELLELCRHELGGERDVTSFALHAILPFLTQDETQELGNLGIDRLSRVAVEIEVVLGEQRIRVVVHCLEGALDVRSAFVGLHRQLLHV